MSNLVQKIATVFFTLAIVAIYIFLDHRSVLKYSYLQSLLEESQTFSSGELFNNGNDTYRMNFSDNPKVIIKGGNNFSPSIYFKIREKYKDSLIYVKVQAKVIRLDKLPTNFQLVLTIHTPGQEKDFWNAAYSNSSEPALDTPELLNGRIKLEGFPVTNESELKLYLWNTGESSLALKSLELSLWGEYKIAGEKMLIQQMEGEHLQVQSGYFPFLQKTVLHEITTTQSQNNQNYHSNTLFHPTSNAYYSIVNNTLTSSSGSFKPQVFPSSSNNKDLMIGSGLADDISVFYTHNIGNTINYYSSKKQQVLSLEIPAPSQLNWTCNNSTINNSDKSIFIDDELKYLYDLEFSNQIFTCKGIVSTGNTSTSSLRKINKDTYILVVLSNGVTMAYCGKVLSSNHISFQPLQFKNAAEKSVLSLSVNDEWKALSTTEFLILSKGWRHGLFKVNINAQSELNIEESFRPILKNKKSPFYFENLHMISTNKKEEILLWYSNHSGLTNSENVSLFNINSK